MADIPPGFELETGTDPAEDHIGPFYVRRDPTRFATGLLTYEVHCNVMGTVHGFLRLGRLVPSAQDALSGAAHFLRQRI